VQDPKYVKAAFSRIADRYVLTNHVLSLGTDILWRKKVGRIVAGWQPESILDVATGTGDLALELQLACPDARVTGSDFCEEMLAYAAEGGVNETIVADALAMPFEDDSYDVLTVAFGLRNMADWPRALQEMRRVLKPGGHLLILDFSLPTGILRGPYRFYLIRCCPK
jgi:demethylmenaquinone methyltransferase/2-methoxy-6-polyprenyl-1,4-benzoquinol methylase